MTTFALPVLVFAQGQFAQGYGTSRLQGLLQQIGILIKGIIPIIIGLALIVFLWGILLYVISKGQDDKDKARGFMIYGILGLFVMVSVWGIVFVLSDAVFGGQIQAGPPVLPRFVP